MDGPCTSRLGQSSRRFMHQSEHWGAIFVWQIWAQKYHQGFFLVERLVSRARIESLRVLCTCSFHTCYSNGLLVVIM